MAQLADALENNLWNWATLENNPIIYLMKEI